MVPAARQGIFSLCSLGFTIARWRAVYICAQLCRRDSAGIEHYVSAKEGEEHVRRTRKEEHESLAVFSPRATSWSPPPLRYPTVNIGCPSPHCSSTVTRLLPSVQQHDSLSGSNDARPRGEEPDAQHQLAPAAHSGYAHH